MRARDVGLQEVQRRLGKLLACAACSLCCGLCLAAPGLLVTFIWRSISFRHFLPADGDCFGWGTVGPLNSFSHFLATAYQRDLVDAETADSLYHLFLSQGGHTGPLDLNRQEPSMTMHGTNWMYGNRVEQGEPSFSKEHQPTTSADLMPFQGLMEVLTEVTGLQWPLTGLASDADGGAQVETEHALSFALDGLSLTYYFGTFIILASMGWLFNASWRSFTGAQTCAISLIYQAVFLLLGYLFTEIQPRFTFLGHCLFAAVAYSTPLTMYGFQRMVGIWPNKDQAQNNTDVKDQDLVTLLVSTKDLLGLFSGRYGLSEGATLLVSLALLRYVHFPPLTIPMIAAIWFAAVNCAPLHTPVAIDQIQLRQQTDRVVLAMLWRRALQLLQENRYRYIASMLIGIILFSLGDHFSTIATRHLAFPVSLQEAADTGCDYSFWFKVGALGSVTLGSLGLSLVTWTWRVPNYLLQLGLLVAADESVSLQPLSHSLRPLYLFLPWLALFPFFFYNDGTEPWLLSHVRPLGALVLALCAERLRHRYMLWLAIAGLATCLWRASAEQTKPNDPSNRHRMLKRALRVLTSVCAFLLSRLLVFSPLLSWLSMISIVVDAVPRGDIMNPWDKALYRIDISPDKRPWASWPSPFWLCVDGCIGLLLLGAFYFVPVLTDMPQPTMDSDDPIRWIFAFGPDAWEWLNSAQWAMLFWLGCCRVSFCSISVARDVVARSLCDSFLPRPTTHDYLTTTVSFPLACAFCALVAGLYVALMVALQEYEWVLTGIVCGSFAVVFLTGDATGPAQEARLDAVQLAATTIDTTGEWWFWLRFCFQGLTVDSTARLALPLALCWLSVHITPLLSQPLPPRHVEWLSWTGALGCWSFPVLHGFFFFALPVEMLTEAAARGLEYAQFYHVLACVAVLLLSQSWSAWTLQPVAREVLAVILLAGLVQYSLTLLTRQVPLAFAALRLCLGLFLVGVSLGNAKPFSCTMPAAALTLACYTLTTARAKTETDLLQQLGVYWRFVLSLCYFALAVLARSAWLLALAWVCWVGFYVFRFPQIWSRQGQFPWALLHVALGVAHCLFFALVPPSAISAAARAGQSSTSWVELFLNGQEVEDYVTEVVQDVQWRMPLHNLLLLLSAAVSSDLYTTPRTCSSCCRRWKECCGLLDKNMLSKRPSCLVTLGTALCLVYLATALDVSLLLLPAGFGLLVLNLQLLSEMLSHKASRLLELCCLLAGYLVLGLGLFCDSQALAWTGLCQACANAVLTFPWFVESVSAIFPFHSP
eukprot:g62998.t1